MRAVRAPNGKWAGPRPAPVGPTLGLVGAVHQTTRLSPRSSLNRPFTDEVPALARPVPYGMPTPLEVLTPPPECPRARVTPVCPAHESTRIDERLALLGQLKETIRFRHYSH